jgi:uncharacterized protein YjiK
VRSWFLNAAVASSLLVFALPACSDRTRATPVTATGGSNGGSGGSGRRDVLPWPTQAPVTVVDDVDEFTGNLSGLSYEPGSDGASPFLWGVRNAPSSLYRLSWNGDVWTSVDQAGWAGGRPLRFPDGKGEPDAEGVTRAEGTTSAIYVSVERDDVVTIPRFSVLRFDTGGTSKKLIATHEWDLTADLPAVDSNLGLEGLAWVPDAFLVAHAFIDESTNAPYDPALHADHGDGLFFVGLEANGMI